MSTLNKELERTKICLFLFEKRREKKMQLFVCRILLVEKYDSNKTLNFAHSKTKICNLR